MKPTAWMKELVPEKGMEWQVKMTAVEEVAKDWEAPVIELYPKKEWVGLTEDEAFACRGHDYFETYKAIEAKLKEKNT